MPAPTLLNTPQGCDLCLFLPFLFHCSFTTNLHVPSILKMLLSSLLLFLLSWVIIIPPENICTPFLTLDLWFICYFPMKELSPPLLHSLTSSLLTPSCINHYVLPLSSGFDPYALNTGCLDGSGTDVPGVSIHVSHRPNTSVLRKDMTWIFSPKFSSK